jgi:uncharacterized membrane protein SpoIIM required for sporulation
MLAEDFINQKRPDWEQLTALLDKARGGLSFLSAAEIQQLGRLYRQATSDLAIARRDFPRHPVNDYLNNLVARGHGEIYRSSAAPLSAIATFFTTTFPQAFRSTWPYTLASFLMFFLPAMLAFMIAYRDTESATLLVPGIEPVIANIRDGKEWWLSINETGRAGSSALIMTNNIRVTFLAFAGGVLLGFLTLYILAQNGLLIGAVAGAAQRFDFADNLWGFIAAHGTVELSVIFIAGGAGLQLGWAIFRPGLLTRRAALVVAARRALNLLIGCVPLLVLAGIIEGFISPSSLPIAVKLMVSLGSGILLYGYLLMAGRSPATADAQSAPSHRRPSQPDPAAGR